MLMEVFCSVSNTCCDSIKLSLSLSWLINSLSLIERSWDIRSTSSLCRLRSISRPLRSSSIFYLDYKSSSRAFSNSEAWSSRSFSTSFWWLLTSFNKFILCANFSFILSRSYWYSSAYFCIWLNLPSNSIFSLSNLETLSSLNLVSLANFFTSSPILDLSSGHKSPSRA